jgi:hypothetical protein
MDDRQAVRISKGYLLDLFSEEKIEQLGLEEVEFDHEASEWFVTLGFSRRWEEPRNPVAALIPVPRTYKVVRISNDGDVISVKIREMR